MPNYWQDRKRRTCKPLRTRLQSTNVCDVQGEQVRVRRSVRFTIAAWITILILTGAFQLYRGDAVTDGIVFLAMAAALIVGETGILSRLDGKLLKPRPRPRGFVFARS